ncbi:MAG: 4Fe-4S cluster-binding domain-containing protein [Lachnospiraceae bacterium]|nr:4Fe-4S cluster-binding domain-containing protein [Lachnospiraceae bacterium]
MKIKYVSLINFKESLGKKKIILFGTTYMAKEAVSRFSSEIKDKIAGAVDNDQNRWGEKFCAENICVDIYGPEYLKTQNFDEIALLIVSKSYGEIRYQLDHMEELDDLHCYIYPWLLKYADEKELYKKRILDPYLLRIERKEDPVYQKIVGKTAKGEAPLLIPGLNVIISNYCNLACKECSALMPYFSKKEYIVSNEIIEDLERLFDCIDACATADVIGGEPLLHPELDKIIEFLIEQKKLNQIRIVSNGTVLIKEEWLKIFSHPKVKMVISDYGYIVKMAALVKQLEVNKINFDIMSNMRWIKTGRPEYMGKSEEDLEGEYYVCDNGLNCKTIMSGKFFGCGRSARLWALRKYNSENDYRDLGDNEELNREAVWDILNLKRMDACNYCNIAREEEYVQPGKQIDNKEMQSKYTIIEREEYEKLLRGTV